MILITARNGSLNVNGSEDLGSNLKTRLIGKHKRNGSVRAVFFKTSVTTIDVARTVIKLHNKLAYH